MLHNSPPLRWVECSQQEIAWLATRDGKMANAIKLIGPIRRPALPDPFYALVHAITGQQISGRAHSAIWRRLSESVEKICPENLLTLNDDNLRSCGISAKKICYIKGIAQEFEKGTLTAGKLSAMTDGELARNLQILPGIGPWTVEMLQIFTFQRKDIMSYGDLGIRRGLERLHGLTSLDRSQFSFFKNLYSPCGTAASLYLWEIAGEKNWYDLVLRGKKLNDKNPH